MELGLFAVTLAVLFTAVTTDLGRVLTVFGALGCGIAAVVI